MFPQHLVNVDVMIQNVIDLAIFDGRGIDIQFEQDIVGLLCRAFNQEGEKGSLRRILFGLTGDRGLLIHSPRFETAWNTLVKAGGGCGHFKGKNMIKVKAVPLPNRCKVRERRSSHALHPVGCAGIEIIPLLHEFYGTRWWGKNVSAKTPRVVLEWITRNRRKDSVGGETSQSTGSAPHVRSDAAITYLLFSICAKTLGQWKS
jgi:hypothetical protein